MRHDSEATRSNCSACSGAWWAFVIESSAQPSGTQVDGRAIAAATAAVQFGTSTGFRTLFTQGPVRACAGERSAPQAQTARVRRRFRIDLRVSRLRARLSAEASPPPGDTYGIGKAPLGSRVRED